MIAEPIAATASLLRHARQRWLVVFNCQAMGLANCLSLLSDEVTVEYHDPISFPRARSQLIGQLDQYDRVIVAPWFERNYGVDFGRVANVWRIPPLNFHGYHPDLCNLTVIGGPLRGNHSVIAFAAYRCGMDVTETIRLFNPRTYEQMGYFDTWNADRAALLEQFSASGLDLGRYFVDWSRHGPFTYIPSHPAIRCLRDLARALLERAGLRAIATRLLPHDNLMNGDVFPVYPELATRLGVTGDYLFKRPLAYNLIGLRQYLEECHAFYRTCTDLNPTRPYRSLFDRAIRTIEASR